MGYVYLIGEIDNPGRYKIGSTRATDVNKRLKQLQTGNASELYIKESFETEHPFRLEKMLHNHFKSSNLIGEWFYLSEDDTRAFRGICEEKMKIIESLKDNPFFFNSNDNGRRYQIDVLKSQMEEFERELDNGIVMELKHE